MSQLIQHKLQLLAWIYLKFSIKLKFYFLISCDIYHITLKFICHTSYMLSNWSGISQFRHSYLTWKCAVIRVCCINKQTNQTHIKGSYKENRRYIHIKSITEGWSAPPSWRPVKTMSHCSGSTRMPYLKSSE